MKKLILFVSFLILLVGAACALPGMLFGSGSKAPPELQYVFETPGEPFSVTPTLSTELQIEAVIPASGGMLTVTGADGTAFQLDIPASALVTDTLIRMIPVSQLDGMPFGSNPYAVQLEPEGLQFYDFVTLTITPAQEIPIDQQIFFGYQGTGENLTLASPVVDSREIKIQLIHFSGYGVTKGFLADIEPVRARIGGDAEARLQSAVAEQLARARQEQFLGNENSEIDFESAFQQYEEQVVKPRIAAAGESCAAGRLALQTVFGVERQKQLLGFESDAGNALIDNVGLMETVADVCMKEEYELCRDQHIIHRIIPAWLGLERQFQLLGFVEQGTIPPVIQKAREYARKCLTFEMRFESHATFEDGGDGYDSTVESKIKIQFNPEGITMKGQAPLVNTAFDWRTEDCSVTSTRGGSTFEAISLAYISDTRSPTDELGYVRDFKFVYYPGNTTESFTIQCEDQPPYSSPASPFWTGVYLVTHESEMSQADGGFLMEDWEILGGEYYAKKEWITESAGLGLVEVGTFKLYHLPE